MKSNIFLLCLAVTICVVAANPLLQALTAQTCPICQQNSYRNQPYVLQQPTTTIPLYSQVYPTQNAPAPQPVCQNPSSYYPCQKQSMLDQNQFAPKIVQNILSNPALKSILDPNVRLYNQDGYEVPRNVPCQNGAPNVVNNYFIVPPEFFLEDGKCNTKESNRVDERPRSRNNGARKRPRQEGQKPGVSTEKRDKRVREREDIRNNAGEVKKRKSRRRRPIKSKTAEVEVKVLNENTTTEALKQIELQDQNKIKDVVQPETNNRTKEEAPSKPVQIVVEIEPNQEIINTNPSAEEYNLINDEHAKALLSQENLEKINITEETKELNKNSDVQPNLNQSTESKIPEQTENQQEQQVEFTYPNNNEPKTNAEQPTGKNYNGVKNVKTIRNSREEAVIQDFLKKFPNIPEELVRDLLAHMKRQIEKEQLGSPTFPFKQFPITYDQLHSKQFANASSKKKSKRRKIRRRKQRKQKVKNESNSRTNVVEATPTLVPVEDETSTLGTTATTTTEKSYTVQEVTLKPIAVTLAAEFIEEDAVKTTTPKTDDESTIPNLTNTNDKDEIQENLEGNVYEKEVTHQKLITHVNDEADKSSHTVGNNEENEKSSEEIDTDYDLNDKIIELGYEDILPAMFMNGLVDDYYPDFTNDPQYYSSEDLPIFTLEDGRYLYTTDKNFELEELNRERRKYDSRKYDNTLSNSKRPQNRYVLKLNGNKEQRPSWFSRRNLIRRRPKPRVKVTSTVNPIILETTTYASQFKNVENNVKRPLINVNNNGHSSSSHAEAKVEDSTENIIAQNIEEIQFRTPPTLEIIDFETKQINKDIYWGTDFVDKTSTYSDFKTPQYNVNEKGDLRMKSREKSKSSPEIETVFARSKVATYSNPSYNEKAKEDLTENDSASEEPFPFVNEDYDDGDKMVVFAKSFPDQFW